LHLVELLEADAHRPILPNETGLQKEKRRDLRFTICDLRTGKQRVNLVLRRPLVDYLFRLEEEEDVDEAAGAECSAGADCVCAGSAGRDSCERRKDSADAAAARTWSTVESASAGAGTVRPRSEFPARRSFTEKRAGIAAEF
jgi:hypothetical protein